MMFDKSRDFLPVGSIVLLKDATQMVSIIGFVPVEENDNKIWDYLGAPYPFGVLEKNKNLLFNRNQIEEIVAVGYSNADDKEFRRQIIEVLEGNK